MVFPRGMDITYIIKEYHRYYKVFQGTQQQGASASSKQAYYRTRPVLKLDMGALRTDPSAPTQIKHRRQTPPFLVGIE